MLTNDLVKLLAVSVSRYEGLWFPEELGARLFEVTCVCDGRAFSSKKQFGNSFALTSLSEGMCRTLAPAHNRSLYLEFPSLMAVLERSFELKYENFNMT